MTLALYSQQMARTLEQRRQAVSNVFDFLVKGGIADTTRMPSEVIDEGHKSTLHRYLPVDKPLRGDPILLSYRLRNATRFRSGRATIIDRCADADVRVDVPTVAPNAEDTVRGSIPTRRRGIFDVGPFEIDHWQYVFGNDSPRPNRNGGAGIDLSPAVRDFLQLRSGASVEWRFADDHEVPRGPWRNWFTPPPPAKTRPLLNQPTLDRPIPATQHEN